MNNLAREFIPAKQLADEFDAVVLSGGAEHPRDLPVPGRELDGIHFAMEFLPLQNRRVAGDEGVPDLWATGKHVVVIGGGDTGSDCVGTSNRHGAKSVTPVRAAAAAAAIEQGNPVWPYWPAKLRTSSSHEEGAKRDWAVATKQFRGENGKVKALVAVRVEWKKDPATGQMKMQEVPGTEFEMPADLVLLAMGFVSPVHKGCWTSSASRTIRAATCKADYRWPGLLSDLGAQGLRRRATCAAASRWWSGRSAKAASARASVDEFLMGSLGAAALD